MQWQPAIDVLMQAAVVVLAAAVLFTRLRRRARGRHRRANSHWNADGRAKRAYRTRRAARAAARTYERDFGGRVSAYRCSRGWHFHIGHSH